MEKRKMEIDFLVLRFLSIRIPTMLIAIMIAMPVLMMYKSSGGCADTG